MTLDEDALTTALASSARAAFEQLRADHPDETFYCYALYTTPEYRWISPLVFGENGLRETATSYDENDIDGQMVELRWSTGDSPYLEMGEEHFGPVEELMAALPHIYDLPSDEFNDRVRRVHECCIAALQRLNDEGFFGAGPERDEVIVTVLQGDQSNRSRLDNTERLNPPIAWQRLCAAMPVTREVGTFTTRGDGIYQVNDLATRRELIVSVAAKRAMAWRDEVALLDTELDGNAWCVAVAETGLVTAVDGDVLWLAFDGSAPVRSARHDARVRSVAVSADGTGLFTSGGGVIATVQGDERWRQDQSGALALSDDERRLYVAGEAVTILDASTGEELGRLEAKGDAFACVAVSSLGAVAAGSNTAKPGRVALWSPSGELVGQLEIPDLLLESAKTGTYRPTGCAAVGFSPDGSRLASAHTSGELHVWDAVTGARITTVRGRHESLGGCGWLDDSRVALCGRDVDDSPAILVFDV